ncbi:unnamed protein product [Hymenolepis diminuta]|uniref:Uncharacterized protein n=1 Tax=Hymenolepis diminuta TaxID=6216 RepID=A0A564ZE69_HYMDI|nr:unnamed protein product [Hymenolepis diminuta]
MHHLAAAAASNSASSGTTLTNSRHLSDYKIGASNLILDGTPINHGSTLNDQESSVIEFEARLNTLPKIPTARLGKGATALIEGDDVPSVFPPSFTVVLGNMPSYLSHRLFTSSTFQQVFSQPANSVPIQPFAAAIIAAPVDPATSGCLFYPIGETDAHSQNVQQVPTIVVGGGESIAEVDESTAAVAELTSEVPAVSMSHAEQYEEEIDESIQISTS